MANNSSKVVVVGSSAGGIEALTRLVAQLPADFAAPMFIVNHMGASTTGKPLVDALNNAGSVKVAMPRTARRSSLGTSIWRPPTSTRCS